jgi:predicted Zn-dependent peptidase
MNDKSKFSLIFTFFIYSVASAQLNVVEYKLDNGMKVFLNPDKSQHDISGAVAVNTGSKNDPETATGISHYLEHLLFKGTTELGTSNYVAEKVHLDSIYYFYDQLGKTTDENMRDQIQKRINYHSVEASKYAMPNEFDKLLKSIGSTGINATTSNDLTIYFNSFPSHQANKWLDIYAHRFQNPVFRSFQSELEVVYEEKNRAMDNLQRRILEAFKAEFYKGHPYGDKTTLGTIKHLKNPSLNKMYDYFRTYYVANNMALILTGNFEVDAIKPMVEKAFGSLKPGKLPELAIAPPKPFAGKQVYTDRLTPIKVGLYGFRTVPSYHPDHAALEVASYLLQNEAGTGFIDDLVNKNKVMMAFSFLDPMDEAGNQTFVIIPKVLVQSFGKVERLLSEQLGKLKEGRFTDERLVSVKNELYKDIQLDIENPKSRIYLISDAFRAGLSWEELNTRLAAIQEVNKADVQRVAKQYFGNDYLAFRSRTGFPKKQKLKKPPFEPLQIDQNQESVYGKKFESIIEAQPQERYIDFENDLETISLGEESRLYVVKNEINEIYTLAINFRKGRQSEPKLEPMEVFMQMAFPKGQTMVEFKEKIGVLGSTISIETTSKNTIVKLTGIEQNIPELLTLVNELITSPEIDENGIKTISNVFRTDRKQEQLNGVLIANAMAQYGLYGNQSVYKNRLSVNEIESLKKSEYLELWKNAVSHSVSIHFSGKMDGKALKKLIEEKLTLNFNGPSEDVYSPALLDRENSEVLLLDNKRLVQSHLFFVKKSAPLLTDNYAVRNVFNQYYSGGFSGILTQEVREYRSLAYASGGSYEYSFEPKPNGYFYTYIGTQADKTNAAAKLTNDIIQDISQKPERFDLLKQNVILTKQSEMPNFRELSKKVEDYQLMGFEKDPNELARNDYKDMTFEDVMLYYTNFVQKYPTYLGIHGDAKQFNLQELEGIGKVRKIKREEVIRF